MMTCEDVWTPLSPLLYILSQQVLSHNMNRLYKQEKIKHFNFGKKVEMVSHLYFADDMIVFLNGGLRSIQNLKKLFDRYEASSGQRINYDKSEVFCSKHININRQTSIRNNLSCKIGKMPFNYLGAPIFKGRVKDVYFDGLVQKVIQKIQSWKNKFLSFTGKVTLLKAVLNSIPIHTISSTVVSKGVIKNLERLFTSFLWSKDGEKRIHWCSWDRICKPKEEGGLGMRSLTETVNGVQGRLAWNLLQKNSLWSTILNQKYKTNDENIRNNTSLMWKRLQPHYHDLKKDSIWIIGQGMVNMWTDNWMGDIISPQNTSQLTVKDAKDHQQSIENMISISQMESLRSLNIDSNIEDKLIYMGNINGKFTVKDYINKRRGQGNHLSWSDYIWHPAIPYKASGFLWRVFQKAVPVDEQIRKRGFIGPSKCRCCNSGDIETINHLFAKSDLATKVLEHFGNILNKNINASSFEQLWNSWIHNTDMDTQYGYISLCFFGISIWEIWKARCKATFDDIDMNAHVIIKKINNQVTLINTYISPKKPSTNWEDAALGRLNIQKKQVQVKRGTWLRWSHPPPGLTKLNVDGGFKNGQGYVGGLLRDEDGIPKMAFWKKVQVQDSEEAEIEAINIGIEICTSMGAHNFIIESDSPAWMKAYMGKTNSSSKIYKTRKYSQYAAKINQIYREENQPADLLAKTARNCEDAVIQTYKEVPAKVKLRIFQDRIGLHSYRKKIAR
ncbi:hypothetical protein CASFOL_020059 [Castilleja foliolosa]|uniref:Uncharacterized protein n=1 Tax=Castilleja foliolosa TaxID=1961234 RepID=A0ABD3D1A7_9LAMI